jgi:hypothetical protein
MKSKAHRHRGTKVLSFSLCLLFFCCKVFTEEISQSTEFRGIFAIDSQNVFLIGYNPENETSAIYFYDGKNIIKQFEEKDLVLNSIWGKDKNIIYAVGYSPLKFSIFKYDGEKWSLILQTTFRGLPIMRDSPTRVTIFFYSIFGLDDSTIFAGGLHRGPGWVIYKYDGNLWIPYFNRNREFQVIKGIWGKNTDNIWAVGTGGIILKYDGTQFKKIDSPTKNALNGIYGIDEKNIYAVGEEGIILKYNGEKWEIIESPTKECLTSIWARNENDIFAVGRNGTILHFNGKKWEIMKSNTTSFLESIYGKNDCLFAVGTNATVLQYTNGEWKSVIKLTNVEKASHEQIEVPVCVNITTPKIPPYEEIEVNFPEGNFEKVEYVVEASSIGDVWDRIFTTSIEVNGEKVEIDRSITDWGYSISYKRDVSQFLSLFNGKRKIYTQILTGFNSSWRINTKFVFYKTYEKKEQKKVLPIFHFVKFEQNNSKISKSITIPEEIKTGNLILYATGHSPQGTGPEEFGPPRNIIIKFDDKEIGNVTPWVERMNPNCHGSMAARSGWSPKDKVESFIINLPNIKPGEHQISVEIPSVTSYWIISLSLIY